MNNIWNFHLVIKLPLEVTVLVSLKGQAGQEGVHLQNKCKAFYFVQLRASVNVICSCASRAKLALKIGK